MHVVIPMKSKALIRFGQFVESDSVFGKKCKMLFALLDDVFTGCCVQRLLLMLAAFLPICGNNMGHFLTRPTLIVSHAML